MLIYEPEGDVEMFLTPHVAMRECESQDKKTKVSMQKLYSQVYFFILFKLNKWF